MRPAGGPELKEMSPLTQIHCNDDLGLERIRQDAASLLRSCAGCDKRVVCVLRRLHRIAPDSEFFGIVIPKVRANKGQLVPEFILTIVAVTSTLLTVARNTVAHKLMSYTAVADKLDRQTAVLDDRAVSARNYHGDKLLRRVSGDPILTLVAHSSDAFKLAQGILVIYGGYNLIARFDYIHVCSLSACSRVIVF